MLKYLTGRKTLAQDFHNLLPGYSTSKKNCSGENKPFPSQNMREASPDGGGGSEQSEIPTAAKQLMIAR